MVSAGNQVVAPQAWCSFPYFQCSEMGWIHKFLVVNDLQVVSGNCESFPHSLLQVSTDLCLQHLLQAPKPMGVTFSRGRHAFPFWGSKGLETGNAPTHPEDHSVCVSSQRVPRAEEAGAWCCVARSLLHVVRAALP